MKPVFDPVLSSIAAMLDQAGEILRNFFGSNIPANYKNNLSIVTEADLKSEQTILDIITKRYPNDLIFSEEAGLSSRDRTAGAHIWVIDPLDGTTNFFNHYPYFCISIARGTFRADGQIELDYGGILDPIRQKKYLAQKGRGAFCNGEVIHASAGRSLDKSFLVTGFYYRKGEELARDIECFARIAHRCQNIRRDGAAALDLALVAEGIFEGFWELGLQPWDVAAGALIAMEAGATVINYHGKIDKPWFDIEGEGLIVGALPIVTELQQLILQQ